MSRTWKPRFDDRSRQERQRSRRLREHQMLKEYVRAIGVSKIPSVVQATQLVLDGRTTSLERPT